MIQAFPRPLETGRFLSVAIACAEALADVHDAHDIHWHVTPYNLMRERSSGMIRLSGGENSALPGTFGDPRTSSRITQQDWPYMSPEQTGRMNRLVDYRTDLYSLGVTFYELITGQLPFQGENLMEWVHFHIARYPSPPHEVLPSVPPVISSIIMKLIDKAAENRYQSIRA